MWVLPTKSEFHRTHEYRAVGTDTAAGWDFDYGANVRVTLIDTPGFGEAGRSDLEILQDIVRFISEPRHRPLAGIIFCHKITDTRLTGSSRQTLRILSEMCGRRFSPHIVFATTMWDTIAPDQDKSKYEAREDELRHSDVGWGDFTDGYASTKQYLGDTASAMRILDQALFHRPPLRIMDQLDRGMTTEETDAGQAIAEEIRRLAKKQRREEEEELRELEKERAQLRDIHQQRPTSSRQKSPRGPNLPPR
jgi:septin family protein